MPEFTEDSKEPFQVLFKTNSNDIDEMSSIKEKKDVVSVHDTNPEVFEEIEKIMCSKTEKKEKKKKAIQFYSERKPESSKKFTKKNNEKNST